MSKRSRKYCYQEIFDFSSKYPEILSVAVVVRLFGFFKHTIQLVITGEVNVRSRGRRGSSTQGQSSVLRSCLFL